MQDTGPSAITPAADTGRYVFDETPSTFPHRDRRRIAIQPSGSRVLHRFFEPYR